MTAIVFTSIAAQTTAEVWADPPHLMTTSPWRKPGEIPMAQFLSELLAAPAWARLDRQEDSLELLLAAEMTDPGSSGCDDLDFTDELQVIATAKAALEVARG